MDKEQVRSLTLAFLMIGSVMLGLFFLGVETDVSDQPPTIEGEKPGSFLIGEVTSITISVNDESIEELELEVTLNEERISDTYVDDNGQYLVDISELSTGEYTLSVVAKDYLNQETTWETEFTISYPDEGLTEIILDDFETDIEHGEDAILTGNLTHSSIESCDFVWSDSDIEQEQLNVPIDENGLFSMDFSDLTENLTVTMEASCGVNIKTTAQVTVVYSVQKSE
jgi:hypothetical protein|tara:strand:- start:414 stop:1091 length:678 start_codon:yes stop_codon:yes gene_type:complete